MTGATAGATQVVVTNVGGRGGQTINGIKIVDVDGASSGTFALKGDYVFNGDPAIIAGAYGYRLYKNGITDPADGDWYLRSSLLNPSSGGGSGTSPPPPLYQPGVPVYESYPQSLLVLNGLPTLQQRVGNRSWTGATTKMGGVWGRVEGTQDRPRAAVSTSPATDDIDSWQMQFGADRLLHEATDGALVGGITARYGMADARIGSIYGNGGIKTKGLGFGATLTWYGAQGFYADGQAQLNWYRSDLTSSVLGRLADNRDGTGAAVSLEIGKRSAVGRTLSVTPQVQMIYSTTDFDRFTDPAGAAVSLDKDDSFKTRWGILLDRQTEWNSAAGDARRSRLYGIVNLSYESLGAARVDVSGTPILYRNDRLWAEVGLGGSYSWGGGRFGLYTDVVADTAMKDFAKSYSFKGTIGLRGTF